MKINFAKMQGLGNDFVLIENLPGRLKFSPERIRFLCDRHFGIGADGILTMETSHRADLRMRVFNADGSEAEMCGNGIRCFALYARREGLVAGNRMSVETLAGIVRPEIRRGGVGVDMGEPTLDGPQIPVNLQGRIIDHPVEFAGQSFRMTCVSMGNPHCVVFCSPGEEPDARRLGPIIENNPLFPSRTNVEFVRVKNRREIAVTVWERGAGLTLACGTGACASVVAGAISNRSGRDVLVHLPGGDLKVNWKKDNHVFLVGPASFVFRGQIEC